MKRRILKILSEPIYTVGGSCVILVLLLLPDHFGLIPAYTIPVFALVPLLFMLASFIWGFNYTEEGGA